MDIKSVVIDRKVAKALRKLPKHIIEKLEVWVLMVEKYGVLTVRKMKGYHDEPLKSQRAGERSIRLNKAYRAIYVEHDNGEVALSYIEVVEVSKHEY